MTATESVEVDVRQLGPLKKIGTGGQGAVYELLDGPNTLVYKEYFPRVVDDVDAAVLQDFVRFHRKLDEPLAHQLMAHTAWPLSVIRRDGVVQGFVMPRVPEEFTVELTWASGRSSVLAQVQYLLNSEDYLRDRGLAIDDIFRLEFLHDVAATLALFHSMGIIVGDLSPNNLLFSLTRRPRCFFIDCDAMRLGTGSVLEQAETPEWRVADIGTEELATLASDSYKLGLLAVRLFAGDQCTKNPAAVGQLSRKVRRMVTASLNDDPKSRAAPEDWVVALQAAIPQVVARSTKSRNRTARFGSRRPKTDPVQRRISLHRRVATLRRAPALTRRFVPAIPVVVVVVVNIILHFLGSGGDTPPVPSAPYTLTPPIYRTYEPIYPSLVPLLPLLHPAPTVPSLSPLPSSP